MAVNLNKGFRRICLVLSVVVVVLTIRAELVDHHHPFLKDYECPIRGEVGSNLYTELKDESYCQTVTDAVEAGYITEGAGNFDVDVGLDAELPPVGSSKEAVLKAQKTKAGIQDALRLPLRSGNPQVPLPDRVDWHPIMLGAIATGLIWSVYRVGRYIAGGFFP
jgi:hypothetical protein